MSAPWDYRVLLEPISADQPCGENVEDREPLTALEGFRLFGQSVSPEAVPEPDEENREQQKVRPPTDWHQLRNKSLEALARSKDLRALGYLSAALLRIDGLPAFTNTLTVAAHWLENYWPQFYPLIDEDAMFRRNALNNFADPMAMVDRVWRMPLVVNRQHGRFGLRELDLIDGRAKAGPTENVPEAGALQAALAAMPLEELTLLADSVTAGTAALESIDAKMRREGGPEMAPDFGILLAHFARANKLLRDQLAARNQADPATGQEPAVEGAAAASAAGYRGGAIKSRQEAIRALDAVATYFRSSEPSSPVPMLVERAKRLVDKDFLAVLADMVPDAVPAAKSAAGVRDQDQ
jgi:type VI secretion system protein ImpA